METNEDKTEARFLILKMLQSSNKVWFYESVENKDFSYCINHLLTS